MGDPEQTPNGFMWFFGLVFFIVLLIAIAS